MLGYPAKMTVTVDYRATGPESAVFAEGALLVLHGESDDYPGWIWCDVGSGLSAWVPKRLIEKSELAGHGRLTEDYKATELSVRTGQSVTALHGEAGWLWCRAEDGSEGWLPADHCEPARNMSKPQGF